MSGGICIVEEDQKKQGRDPNGNAEPFVGDEESLNVGWFSPDDLPQPLADTTVERGVEYLRAMEPAQLIYIDPARRDDRCRRLPHRRG